MSRKPKNGNSNGKNKNKAQIDIGPRKITVRALTKGQNKYISAIKDNRVILCSGPAGTGKTAIAVGIALQQILASNRKFKKLVVMRPVREACGENLGFLPGDLQEKMSPWIQPVLDNMMLFLPEMEVEAVCAEGLVDVVPLAYARGRTFNESFIILDEAQNCSPSQMLLALTRLGKDSKMVVNGDIGQKDEEADGLDDAIWKLGDLEGVAAVELQREDIVRDPLIADILERYEG